ncbi:hypothetical protein AX16_000219 [Volvariella volvacea WC 439]|uniref:Polarity protein BemA n=1 Tax=Volvariella volvacea TaxID=36659 RepID=A0A2H4V2E4_9AGAR|nr:polarity protein BemA [Volvariella volvacea]KAF8665771.1 hypothetical protein AX16_000219 [Volvariella volvacea WC 439]
MKSLRKSLNGGKDSIRSHISTPQPLPSISKPPSTILPPQKVIRAISGYKSQAPQELSFQKGDFFYVLQDDSSSSAWYEAHNPATGARGLVPRTMFEEFGKTAHQQVRTSQFGGQGLAPLPANTIAPTPSNSAPKHTVYYAVVLHDFVAERADELDAKKGDTIAVVAQSNREWFVGKHIGRLGRPGLIPVSFVEVRDPTTGGIIQDVHGLMDRGDLPKVEDWKRAMYQYKQNSITLGVIDTPPAQPTSYPQKSYSQVEDQASQESSTLYEESARPESPDALPEGLLLSARVVSFHYEADDYWFRIDATFQPYADADQSELPPAKSLILFRVYNDFYDFQVSLLDTFPREAGREPPHPRSLPYMPGPADTVDDALTANRRGELDVYVGELCNLNRTGGRYILESDVVRRFFAPKRGDAENDTAPRSQELEELLGGSGYIQDEYDSEQSDPPIHHSATASLQRGVSNLSLQNDGGRADGPDYDDTKYTRAHHSSYDPHPHPRSDNQRLSYENVSRASQSHRRSGSSSSHLQNSPYPASSSRSNSPLHHSPQRQYQTTQQTRSRGSDHSNQSRWDAANYVSSSPTNSRSSSGRPPSHTPSASISNVNSPSISAANPQTAFVKIKIFDIVANDVIAIRVHPRVTYAELMEKVHQRLGPSIKSLIYRDSITNAEVHLTSDAQLSAWIDATDKHILYAEQA